MGRQFSVIASICQRLIRSSSNGGIPEGSTQKRWITDHPGLFAFNGQRATKGEGNDCD